tara:strand:- start:17194 stop:17961 length:768 start_codon:yes stop_codon:yes gene_type:complete
MIVDILSKKNTHKRDLQITFDEGPHIYTIDGDSDYMSVTTWNHSHFENFNADAIITNMMKSKKWSKSKYYGMTREEIKSQWDNNRDNAADAGTKMHYDIECYYNDVVVNNQSLEYQYFQKFVSDYPELVPYRTEWMIWDKELRFAGSIDMVYENPDGTLMIYDWKRSKSINKSSPYMKFSHTPCIEHIPDTNFWHYSLQLNTYKAILEKNYEKKVTDMMLICLYPDNDSYQLIRVPDLSDEVNDLFNLRKLNMKK